MKHQQEKADCEAKYKEKINKLVDTKSYYTSCYTNTYFIMAKQSEAIVLQKAGGRQNVVLISTLKHTCLTKQGSCLNLS